MTEEQPRYSTLRDYLALLGRQKLVVIAVTLVFGGAALALSASQEESFETQSAVQFNDIARDVSLTGQADLPADTNPLVNAAVKSEEITSLETARKVKRRLEVEFSPDRLQSAIETNVGSQTIFVQVTATWDDPEFAARLADEFAAVAADEENKRFSNQLEATIKELEPLAKGPLLSGDAQLNLPRFNAQNTLSQVRTLKSQVDSETILPAEVARRAEVPDSPSSPRTARNTVLGLIVGFALGLLAGFARDTLDRRLRTASDAHEKFGLPVLGRVSKTALGSTGAAQNAQGAGLVTPADIESFRMLRTNLAALIPEGAPRSVMITSGLPQEGKSTVASSVAAASAAAGQRTLLVDADLRRPVLATRLGIPSSPGLSEYLAGTAEPQEILQTVAVNPSGRKEGTSDSNRSLICIPAGNPMGEPAELLASERCRDFFQKVSRAYDLVVIDTSPMLATADPLELMPHVESVLICVRLPNATGDEAQGVKNAMALFPERPTGLIVTGDLSSDGYYGYYGY